MRILYLIADFPSPVTGGHRVQTDNLLKYMSYNHDCHVLGFCNNTDLPQTIEAFSQRCPEVRILGLFPCRSGLALQLARVQHLLRLKPVFLARFKNDSLNRAVNRALRETDYDLIHLEGISIAPFVSLCRSKPTLLSTVDAVSLVYRGLADAGIGMGVVKRIYERFAAWSTSCFERRVLPKATKVHVFHQPDCQYFRTFNPTIDVEQIGMSLPEELVNYPLSESRSGESPCILFWGALNIAYVADGLVRFLTHAYPAIYKECPNVEMVVLGRGAPPHLRELMKNTRNLRHIEWAENYCKEVVKSHVVIFPELPISALKTRAIQAMALGKPIVAWPRIFQGTSMEDGVHCFQREPDKGFVEAVLLLLQDEELRKRMGQNARSLVLREYSMESIGSQWLNLYNVTVLKFHENELRI